MKKTAAGATEQLAQDMLTAGNEHFQVASQPQRVAFWLAATDGRCEMVNGGWTELTGQTPALAPRDHCAELAKQFRR